MNSEISNTDEPFARASQVLQVLYLDPKEKLKYVIIKVGPRDLHNMQEANTKHELGCYLVGMY